ncbi:MAG: TonB-dependent receptor [Terracidiphilus sp.]
MIYRIKGTVPLVLSLVCMCFLTLAQAGAQVTTADIVGTATDPSGAAVVTGTATLTSMATGVTQKVTLSSTGGFEFTLLPAGTYRVMVQSAGFKTFETQVTVAIGDRARVAAQLAVGQAEQTVTVESTTPALQTDESSIGTLITSQATQDLPLNGRNVLNLVTLSAGVTLGLSNAMNSGTRPDDRRQGSNFSANGQSDEINNNMIDGMDNNERFIGSVGAKPAIDAIEEVKVLTNLYTAEVTRTGGGVVDLITKSGTNKFHGTAYEFLRNDKLDARDYFDTVGPKPELRQNQFGGSIGGPIHRDKTFFFFDIEELRLIKGVTNDSTVPTLYEEQNPGDFSDLQLSTDTCTGTNISATGPKGSLLAADNGGIGIGMNYFKLYPAPNLSVPLPGGCSPPSNNYSFTGGETQFTKTWDLKIDHRITPKDSIFGRYTFNNANVFIPGNYPIVSVAGVTVNPGQGPYGNFAGPAVDQDQSVALGYTRVLSSNLILDLKAQYMRLNHDSTPVNVGQDTANAFGFPCIAGACVNISGFVATTGLPNMNFNQGYGGLGDADYVPLLNQNNSFEYVGSFSWVKHGHSTKFGGSVIRRQGSLDQSAHPRGQIFDTGYLSALQTNSIGNSLADMLEDYGEATDRIETLVPPSLRTSEFGAYFQDDWRATPKLTLNLGVRWDLYTPFSAANGAWDNWNPALGIIVGPDLVGVQHTGPTQDVTRDYNDWAPRIGMAYSVTPNLVVRAGYGIGYFPGNDANGGVAANAPWEYGFGCGTTLGGYTTEGSCQTATSNFGNLALDPLGGYYMDKSMPIPVVNTLLATDPYNYQGTTVYARGFNYRNPYLQQFSLNVEKDFFHGNVLTVAYVGNRGQRLPLNGTNQNQLPYPIADGGQFPYNGIVPATCSQYADCDSYYTSGPGAAGTGILDTVNVQIRETILKSNYNAGQASLQRRFKNGISANINYTFSRNLTNAQVIDEGQGVGNCVGPCHVDNGHGQAVTENSYFRYDYGNADLDTRHSFSLTGSYDLPWGKGVTGPLAYGAKGWSFNVIYYAHTGEPFTVSNANGSLSGIGLGNDRPNYVPSSQHGFHKTVRQWFDVTRFEAQGVGLQGNEERNEVYAPGVQSLDLSLFKTFPIYESLKLEFRAESFNLLNTAPLGTPGSGISDYLLPDGSTTGNPTPGGIAVPNTGVGEISGTNPLLAPRQLQFALKLIF